jgi:hypothetical protein
MAGHARFKIKDVAEALEKGAGIPSLAAQILAKLPGGTGTCTAQTVRNYLKRYASLRDVVDESVETTLDLCESKVVTAINGGDNGMVRFYLLTKGKNRGYSLRHEMTGVGGKPIEVTDAKDRLLAELEQMGQRLAAVGDGEPRLIPGRANGATGGNGADTTDPATVGE